MKKLLLPLIILSVLILSASCHWDIWGSTVTEYGKGTGAITTTENFTGDAPAFVQATKGIYGDRIVITWNKVTGADFYEIYRKEDSTDSEWERLPSNAVDTTSCTDTDVEAGKTYLYRVRARSFTNLSLLGTYSDTAYGSVLTAPITFTAAQGEDIKSIHLEWSAVENVRGYRIYWSTTGYSGTWSQVIPDGMQVYSYTYAGNITEADFVPAKQYRGAYIYFYIVSLSTTGEESSPSSQRTGYTRVEGAPSAAKNFTASRGEDTESINLTWDSMYPDNDDTKSYDWDIYRSAEGESETLIYSTKNGDPKPTVVEGRMTYEDSTSLNAGTAYTYKIIAIGDVTLEDGSVISANGSPSTAEGFLLSPPEDIVEKRITDGGFEFVFTDALGAQENASVWSYTVYGRTGDSDTWHVIEEYSNIAVSAEGRYTVRSAYTGEGSYEYFSVRTNAGFNTSRRYDEVVNSKGFFVSRPVASDGFNASDNKVYSGMSASSGCYPVALTFSSDTTAVTYDIRVWTEEVKTASASGYTEYKGLTASSLDSNTLIIRTDITTGIGKKYYFAVKGNDTLGREGEWSRVDSGYSAITGNMLIKYMQIYCLKPWEHIDTKYLTSDYPYPDKDINTKWKNSAIYAKIKQAGTGSLSDGITEDSYFNGGTIKYSAVVQGVGGRVSFSYNKFGEVEWMNTTGSYTMNVSMSGSGDATGGLTVKGWYPATIGMTNISVSDQKFVGTYTVTQTNGLSAEEVSPDQN